MRLQVESDSNTSICDMLRLRGSSDTHHLGW